MVLNELLSDEEILGGVGGKYGDGATTRVTIVITDVNDELPVFSRDKVSVPIPEDVG
jgi:hypothetical protein